MPRRRSAAVKRKILPDCKYGSEVVGKFINYVMMRGKRTVAERIVYLSFTKMIDKIRDEYKSILEKEDGESDMMDRVKNVADDKNEIKDKKIEVICDDNFLTLKAFDHIIQNVSPQVYIRSVRVSGAVYKVPVEIPKENQINFAMKWLVKGARKRKGKSMIIKLTDELVDAFRKSGFAIKMKDDLHRMAMNNRAFAHLKW